MSIQTETIDLGDEDHAEIYLQTRHGTSRQIQEIYQPYMQMPKVVKVLMATDGTEKDRLAKITQIVNKSSDFLKVNEVMILGQVKSWTFGAVTQEVLDDIPETKAEKILAGINRHAESPLADSGARN